jgi:hypothetical protein
LFRNLIKSLLVLIRGKQKKRYTLPQAHVKCGAKTTAKGQKPLETMCDFSSFSWERAN